MLAHALAKNCGLACETISLPAAFLSQMCVCVLCVYGLLKVDSPPLPPVDMALTAELSLQVRNQFIRLVGDRRIDGRREEGGDEAADLVQLRLSNICSYIILSNLAENERVTPALQVFLLQAVEEECEGTGKEELRLLAKKEIISALIKPGVQQMMNVRDSRNCSGCA